MKKGYICTYNYKIFDGILEVGKEYYREQYSFYYFDCYQALFDHYYVTDEYIPPFSAQIENLSLINKDFKLLEINDLDKNSTRESSRDSRIVRSSHIEVLREITDLDELMKMFEVNWFYDKNTKTFTVNMKDGAWMKQQFNDEGKEILWENSRGQYKKSSYISGSSKPIVETNFKN
jgi:hypothetical protein